MNTFHFQHPLLLAFIWVPLLFGFSLLLLNRRSQTPTAFVDLSLVFRLMPPTRHGRWLLQSILILVGLVAAWLALARPTWGQQEIKISRHGRDIMVLLDVSRSMLARDVRPNRLARAKADLLDLVHTLSGDRIGLIAFRARPVLLCPLTTDYRFFQTVLDSASPASAPPGPTDIGLALEKAFELLQRHAPTASQAIVLISDGEDLAGRAEEVARKLRDAGIPLYTVGYGTPTGDTIPGDDEAPLQYQGEIIRTRLESQSLKTLADLTGGAYWPIGAFHTNLGALYHAHLRRHPSREYEETTLRKGIERFTWFLLPAILAFLLAATLSPGRPLLRRILPLFLAMLLTRNLQAASTSTVSPPSPMRQLKEAEQLHRANRPLEAAQRYEQTSTNLTGQLQAIAEYNAGCAFLDANRADDAARLFSRRSLSPDPRRLPFQYNRGCALLRSADTLKGWETNAVLAKTRAERLTEATRAFQSAALSETSGRETQVIANLAYAVSNALKAASLSQTLARIEQFGSLPPDRLVQHLLDEQRTVGREARQALTDILPKRLNRFDQIARRQRELAELLPLMAQQLAQQPPPHGNPQIPAQVPQQVISLARVMSETAEQFDNGNPSAVEQTGPIEQAVYRLWKDIANYPALLKEDITVQSNLLLTAQSAESGSATNLSVSELNQSQLEAGDLTRLFSERFAHAVPESGLFPFPPADDGTPTNNTSALTPETRARILQLAQEAHQIQSDAATAWKESDWSAARSLSEEALHRLLEIERLLPKDPYSCDQPAPSDQPHPADQPNPSDQTQQPSQPQPPDQSEPTDQQQSQTIPPQPSDQTPLSEDESRSLLDRALLREKEYLDERTRRSYVEPAYGERDW